jgi:hypothetical protein
MDALGPALALLLLGAPDRSPSPGPSASASPGGADRGVVIFLVDNSASLPKLDPNEKRVAALEKMFGFLDGRPYRLILFGGRREVFVDEPDRYLNNGKWTDFYFAFERARELTREYPEGTEFRMILLTDAILDPGPADWEDLGGPPAGEALKGFAVERTRALVAEMEIPLYVILVGEPPADGEGQGEERAPQLILDLVRAANGARASEMAQTLSAFFADDGLLVRKFVFRVAPNEGLERIEPVVRRIVAPPRPQVEAQVFTFLVLPLTLTVFLLLGIAVRSFPGPGDLEVLELRLGVPVHVAADRLHKLESGGWAPKGLSLARQPKDAAATFTYQVPAHDLTGAGVDTSGADALTLTLLPLGIEDLRRKLEHYSDEGTKEEKIYALNLDYVARNLDPRQAERVLKSGPQERRRTPAVDFLRAKTHLLANDDLRRSLIEPRVQVVGYGRGAERKELSPGDTVKVGRYRFRVVSADRGGRKDVRLVLYYDGVPSLLGLKTLLPDVFQKVFRIRRSSQRLVA